MNGIELMKNPERLRESPEQNMATAKETANRLKSYGGVLGAIGNFAEKQLIRTEKINAFANVAHKAYNKGDAKSVDYMYLKGTQLEKLGAYKATMERMNGLGNTQLMEIVQNKDCGRLERACAKKEMGKNQETAHGQKTMEHPRVETGFDAKENRNSEDDSREENIEKRDPTVEKITKAIGTPEGIKALMEKHPERVNLQEKLEKTLETLSDPDASPAEIRSAQASLSNLKGQLLEMAAKDMLAESGFTVEPQQRVVPGESGGTRPDVIAVNNTNHPIEAFGCSIQPGETICAECKCGRASYLKTELTEHIPNQLSGQKGTKILLATSDINNVPDGLAERVCNQYNAKLIKLDIGVSDVEKAITEVAKE